MECCCATSCTCTCDVCACSPAVAVSAPRESEAVREAEGAEDGQIERHDPDEFDDPNEEPVDVCCSRDQPHEHGKDSSRRCYV